MEKKDNNSRFIDDPSLKIIACGPIIPRGDGLLQRRIVLRDLGNQYVTHEQIWHENGEISFGHGNYFRKYFVSEDKEDTRAAAAAALEDFMKRCFGYHGWE